MSPFLNSLCFGPCACLLPQQLGFCLWSPLVWSDIISFLPRPGLLQLWTQSLLFLRIHSELVGPYHSKVSHQHSPSSLSGFIFSWPVPSLGHQTFLRILSIQQCLFSALLLGFSLWLFFTQLCQSFPFMDSSRALRESWWDSSISPFLGCIFLPCTSLCLKMKYVTSKEPTPGGASVNSMLNRITQEDPDLLSGRNLFRPYLAYCYLLPTTSKSST